MPDPLISDIKDDEWRQAEAYFKKNPKESKLRHDDKANRNHSFIRAGKEIYAVQRGECLGQGAFGIVKVVQNKQGENYALKIVGIEVKNKEKKGIFEKIYDKFKTKDADAKKQDKIAKFTKAQGKTEPKIMTELGIFKGTTKVHYDKPKQWKKKKEKPTIVGKEYTVQTLRAGDELEKQLPKGYSSFSNQATLTDQQKLIVALKACENINFLHSKGILHCDIKPANFMADIKGNHIVIAAIDFGFSQKLKKGENEIKLPFSMGSPIYKAPEIRPNQDVKVYSRQTDIYALGKMLESDLGLTDPIIKKMQDDDPKKRPSLNEVGQFLERKLGEMALLDPANKPEDSQARMKVILESDKNSPALQQRFDQLNQLYGIDISKISEQCKAECRNQIDSHIRFQASKGITKVFSEEAFQKMVANKINDVVKTKLVDYQHKQYNDITAKIDKEVNNHSDKLAQQIHTGELSPKEAAQALHDAFEQTISQYQDQIQASFRSRDATDLATHEYRTIFSIMNGGKPDPATQMANTKKYQEEYDQTDQTLMQQQMQTFKTILGVHSLATKLDSKVKDLSDEVTRKLEAVLSKGMPPLPLEPSPIASVLDQPRSLLSSFNDGLTHGMREQLTRGMPTLPATPAPPTGASDKSQNLLTSQDGMTPAMREKVNKGMPELPKTPPPDEGEPRKKGYKS